MIVWLTREEALAALAALADADLRAAERRVERARTALTEAEDDLLEASTRYAELVGE